MNFIKNKKGGAGLIEGKPAYLIVVLALAGFLYSVLAAVTIGFVADHGRRYGDCSINGQHREATIHGMAPITILRFHPPTAHPISGSGYGVGDLGSVMQAIIRNPG